MGYGFSRSSFSWTASRMNAARRFGPANASMRAMTDASSRTSVVLVSSSRLSGGRPILAPLSDIDFSASPTLFPISLIDTITDAAYISDIAYGSKVEMTNDSQPLPQFCGQPWEVVMFSRSAFFVKTTGEWAALAPRRSVESAAKRFAREHMVAVVMLANDDAVMYLYDAANDRVATKIVRQPEWGA